VLSSLLLLATLQTFDVAALKENKSGETTGQFGGPASRFTATNVPALQFILYAYEVREFQIEGGPNWIKTDRYDINARAEGNFPAVALGALDPRRTMLRGLLVDRFKLAAHKESRERPIYALVTARADKSLGPQLHPSTLDCAALGEARRRGQASGSPPRTPAGDPDCSITTPRGRVSFGSIPMSQVAAVLSSLVQRVVIDRTGLTGSYSAAVTYAADGGQDAAAADPNSPSLFTALEEQLGLRLESTKGKVDLLVIDHIEKPTTD